MNQKPLSLFNATDLKKTGEHVHGVPLDFFFRFLQVARLCPSLGCPPIRVQMTFFPSARPALANSQDKLSLLLLPFPCRHASREHRRARKEAPFYSRKTKRPDFRTVSKPHLLDIYFDVKKGKKMRSRDSPDRVFVRAR